MTMTTPNINRYLKRFENRAYDYRGSSMGRRDRLALDDAKLYCQRVRPHDSGDYDAGGAYWGGLQSSPLWAIFNVDFSTLIFVRAYTRDAAKAQLPHLTKRFHK